MKDELFNINHKNKFSFNKDVASVFDDMLNRSIPFYQEVLTLSASLINKYTNDDDTIYDLGSSTLNLLLYLERNYPSNRELIGIDNSKPMMQQAKNKIKAYNSKIKLLCYDVEKVPFKKAKVFISNYTLQFISPDKRISLLKNIFNSLHSGGILILSEKVISDNELLNLSFIDIYHDYKSSNGYTQTQIEKKKEALEDILIPFSVDKNMNILKEIGFANIDIVFKWVNFSTFVCTKA